MKKKLWIFGVLLILGIFMSGCMLQPIHHELTKIKVFYLAGFPGDLFSGISRRY